MFAVPSQLLGDKWRRAAERHFTSAGTQTSSASESDSDAAAGRQTAATRLLWACEEAINNLQPSLVIVFDMFNFQSSTFFSPPAFDVLHPPVCAPLIPLLCRHAACASRRHSLPSLQIELGRRRRKQVRRLSLYGSCQEHQRRSRVL